MPGKGPSAAAFMPALIASTSTPEGSEGENAYKRDASGGKGSGGCGRPPRALASTLDMMPAVATGADAAAGALPFSLPLDLAVICFCLPVGAAFDLGGAEGDVYA